MLFSNNRSDKIRDDLIKLVEAAIFCMRIIENPSISGFLATQAAHKALYEALVPIVDDNIASNFEYHYMLDQVSHRIKPFISEDMFSN